MTIISAKLIGRHGLGQGSPNIMIEKCNTPKDRLEMCRIGSGNSEKRRMPFIRL